MKYTATKNVKRYLHGKTHTILTKGETYSQEQVDTFPIWYIPDGLLIKSN